MLGVWLIAELVLAVPRALAQPAEITLDAQLPPELSGCTTLAQLNDSYSRARAAYGRGREAPAIRQLRAAVTSRPATETGTTLLQITAFDGDRTLGMRELPVRVGDCAALPDALGLVLALLARDAEAPATDALPVRELATPDARTSQPTAAKLNGASQPHTYLGLGASAGVVFGTLPSSALALQLMAATPGEYVSLRLKAGMLWPQERALAEGIVEMRSYELALEVCGGLPWPGFSRLWLRVCGGPRLGVMQGRGRNFRVDNLSARELLLYVGAMPELALRVASATWLQLGAGAALAVVRPRFQIDVAGARPIVELSAPEVLRGELGLSVMQIF